MKTIQSQSIQELITSVLKAKQLADILNMDQFKSEYRSLVKRLHPDYCKEETGTEALIHLNKLKLIHEKGIEFEDDAGTCAIKPHQVIYKGDHELLDISYKNYRILKRRDDAAARNFHRYLPDNMQLSSVLEADLIERAIPLGKLVLPEGHCLWILSRMLEVCAWFAQEGFVHGGINPESVYVVPETHGLIIGSFYHMTSIGDKLKTISAKYKNWYPTEVFDTKKANSLIDMELCKRTTAYLLGDGSGMGIKLMKTHNRGFIDFLLKQHESPYECYDEFRTFIRANYKKQFLPLEHV